MRLVDQTSAELISFMSYTLSPDSVAAPFAASINFAKVEKNNSETFKVIFCWSYGTYGNLANLCNEST